MISPPISARCVTAVLKNENLDLTFRLTSVTSCWDLDVLPPKNGKRTGNDFGIGSTVTFSCDEGYELDGESKLTCRSDGLWSDMVPLCKGMFNNLRPYFCSLQQSIFCITKVFPLNSTDRCEGVSCKAWEKCVYDSSSGIRCVCRDNLECPADFQPVCGSDANSYNNYCILKATACRQGKGIEKASDGPCTPGMPVFAAAAVVFFFFFFLFHFISFHFISFYFILFYFIFFCFVLFCFVLFYFNLFYFIFLLSFCLPLCLSFCLFVCFYSFCFIGFFVVLVITKTCVF